MSIRYPRNTLSNLPEIIRKATKLAHALADDWWNYTNNTDDFEWVPNEINVSIDSYAENDDGSDNREFIYLNMEVNSISIQVWVDGKNANLDADNMIELFANGDLDEDELTQWVESVEEVINKEEGRVLSIYDNEGPLGEYDEQINYGTFNNFVYICPDIALDEGMSEEEQAMLYRKHFEAIESVVVAMFDDKELKDFRLVVTPLVCDEAKNHGHTPPKDKNNYIVTPLNEGDLDLIEKIIVTSGNSHKGIAAYVAVELNDDAPGYNEHLHEGTDSEEHLNRIFALAMQLGSYIIAQEELPVTMYIDMPDEGFVEQYFDFHVKDKVDGHHLGEGFIKKWYHEDPPSSYTKYRLFENEESTGYEFTKYRLSKEALAKHSKEFRNKPWVELDSAD